MRPGSLIGARRHTHTHTHNASPTTERNPEETHTPQRRFIIAAAVCFIPLEPHLRSAVSRAE